MDAEVSPAASVGAIIAYVLVGYLLVLISFVALFCFCFVRCNCRCDECCGSRYCRRCACSPKVTRKQRVHCPNCPTCIKTSSEEAEGRICEQCCGCCEDDQCDGDTLTFWGEVVVLVVLCLPLAIILLVLFASARN